MTHVQPAAAVVIDHDAPRSVPAAMMNGARQLCPACGQGALFTGFLKTAPECSACRTDLSHHRADDAPPYFTILIVGHVVGGGALALEKAYAPPIWLHMALWLTLTVVLSLMLLPRIKGALIGLQWALRMHGFGGEQDQPEPDPAAALEERQEAEGKPR